MKKVIINLLSFSEEKYYGVGVYFRDVFVKNMNEIFPEGFEITVLYLAEVPIENIFPFPHEMNIRFKPVKGLSSRFLRVCYEQLSLPFVLKGYDAIYSPNNINPIIRPSGCKSIITIHDLLPFKKNNRFGFFQKYYLCAFTMLSAKTSLAIITVSNFSKNDIVRTLKVNRNKVYVTYNVLSRVSSQHVKVTNDSFARKKYFLYVGALQKDKQLDLAIKSFHEFIKEYDYDLIIAGGDQGAEMELRQLIDELGLSKVIHLVGYISEQQKWDYYRGCEALILLGKNEGFGIPVLEAMSVYKPSIVCDAGALPEIVGNTGFVVKSNIFSVHGAMKKIVLFRPDIDIFDNELERFSVKKQVFTLYKLFQRYV